ncbi:Putative Mn2+ efflux pump MntP [Methylobacillus rhizosphaerae]|uniref:Putative manganese efflux pump MntP n=1 Tax=Methylobacillus rhizosphaerae TaxID=551994 RepID=A0A238ZLQ3_9PROT|nr:manganese efflux pump MntP family protein [Methylobacillus rhizosphaerae]SNR83991.1 Putative Mn2+ efflux pump MntP [Methylobacillus rhizosphaerae]
MNILSVFLLALAMSADAFAAAIGKGAMLHRPRLVEALRTGIIFGSIEAVTPLIGWGLGRMAAGYVTAWDHWIAFAILSILGVRMIWSGLKPDTSDHEKPRSHSFALLAVTALGTSIDAMSVGVSLAFLDVDILPVAAMIGIVTCIMVSIGVLLGRMLGSASKHSAEIIGGMLLIGIGSLILYQHLSSLTG